MAWRLNKENRVEAGLNCVLPVQLHLSVTFANNQLAPTLPYFNPFALLLVDLCDKISQLLLQQLHLCQLLRVAYQYPA
jgi:hypothetical protein